MRAGAVGVGVDVVVVVVVVNDGVLCFDGRGCRNRVEEPLPDFSFLALALDPLGTSSPYDPLDEVADGGAEEEVAMRSGKCDDQCGEEEIAGC